MFIGDYKSLLVGKAVAVVSFDSGPLKPTDEERQRGWSYDTKAVAYFDVLTEEELKENICANNWDEWYLFDQPKGIEVSDVFVNYSGFRLIALS